MARRCPVCNDRIDSGDEYREHMTLDHGLSPPFPPALRDTLEPEPTPPPTETPGAIWTPPGATANKSAGRPPNWAIGVAITVGALVIVGILGAIAGSDDKTSAPMVGTTTTLSPLEQYDLAHPQVPATTATTMALTGSAGVARIFEESRLGLAKAIESNGEVESVDRFTYVESPAAVNLDITSIFTTDKYIANTAWTVTREVSPIWEPYTTRADLPPPVFNLTVNATPFRCPADFMKRLATKNASRTDWEASCR